MPMCCNGGKLFNVNTKILFGTEVGDPARGVVDEPRCEEYRG